ncbi:hypothetical protein BGZ92_005519 [Podila epicladia]|nr:hypothetical protein BGZ92_005519 [Podila epicladia]
MTDNITDNNTSKNTINNNAMSNTTDNLLTLFCLVDGEWNPFSVEVDRTKTVDMLKDAIKDKNAIAFTDVDAKMHPLAFHTPIPARATTPLPGYLSAISRIIRVLARRYPVSDLRVDIKKITDKFFAPGTQNADFLDAYVRGEMMLPVTTTGHTWPSEGHKAWRYQNS